MPADERTYYPMTRLHGLFAVAAVALLLTTIGMIVRDHRREWKPIQRQARQIERRFSEWGKYQAVADGPLGEQDPRLAQLDAAIADQRSTWLDPDSSFPLPGRRFLELPFLDAFNPPLRIDNRWSEGLTQDFHFAQVNRFDRCITCHTAIDRPAAAEPAVPAGLARYPRAEVLELLVTVTAAADESDPADGAQRGDLLSDLTRRVERLGIRLAESGLFQADPATVMYVRPASPAAQARERVQGDAPCSADEIRRRLMGGGEIFAPQTSLPGLRAGDVLVAVDGRTVTSRLDALFLLAQAGKSPGQNGQPAAASDGEVAELEGSHADGEEGGGRDGGRDGAAQIAVMVRRGLDHPYAGHPRLDLFVSDRSPHPVDEFACSICHGGEGSGTSFRRVSHSPGSEEQRSRWRDRYGWSLNPDWAYPMLPARFLESSCLRCHHEVTDLLPSDRFPDPPAPQLLRGYELIQHWGCYGCHEIDGFDGQRRVGPHLKLEPLAGTQRVGAEAGALRRVGPNLRAVAERLDSGYLRRWIRDPEAVRSSARMPRYFGLWQHLETPERGETAGFEAAEIEAIATYLESVSVPDSKAALVLLPSSSAALDRPRGRVSPRLADGLGEAGLLADPGSRDPDSTSEHSAVSRPATRSGGDGSAGSGRFSTGQVADAGLPLAQTMPVPPEIPPDIERGREAFLTRGCLACHAHEAFGDAESYRQPGALLLGPDLSQIGEKYASPRGRQWLQRFLLQPSTSLPGTRMPEGMLRPLPWSGSGGEAASEAELASEIAEFLVAFAPGDAPGAESENAARAAAPGSADPEGPGPSADPGVIDRLVFEHLRKLFPEVQAQRYLREGLPPEALGAAGDAEQELTAADGVPDGGAGPLSSETKLRYLGRKTIAKYGCYACHEIAGFEAARPIGVGLADWGRKDPGQLGFESIAEYVSAKPIGARGEAAPLGGEESLSGDESLLLQHPEAADAGFYRRHLREQDRIGFLHQKLVEPRSFDYRTLQRKGVHDRLRMPRFPLAEADREAVMTFVLGLLAQPPAERFVYQPNADERARIEGRRVLDSRRCGACHVLRPERWELAFEPGSFPAQAEPPTFPGVAQEFAADRLEASLATDALGRRHAVMVGAAMLDDRGQPLAFDEFGDELFEDERYQPGGLEVAFQLWEPAVIDGRGYHVSGAPLSVLGAMVQQRRVADGGELARYLLPLVVQREQRENSNARGAQAWGWLPPPLVGEGLKVQPAWLHDYLLAPYPIRPASVMRMPRFDLTRAEAAALADYFAARDAVDYPYAFIAARSGVAALPSDLSAGMLAEGSQVAEEETVGRLDAAMRMVVDKNYCVTCHVVGDFVPETSLRAMAPDLSGGYPRFRPEYLRRWIARPVAVLPYTAMPVNIPYLPDQPQLGGVDQRLIAGTSVEQLEALVELLMNFDVYARHRSRIAPLVEQARVEAAASASERPRDGAPPR